VCWNQTTPASAIAEESERGQEGFPFGLPGDRNPEHNPYDIVFKSRGRGKGGKRKEKGRGTDYALCGKPFGGDDIGKQKSRKKGKKEREKTHNENQG